MPQPTYAPRREPRHNPHQEMILRREEEESNLSMDDARDQVFRRIQADRAPGGRSLAMFAQGGPVVAPTTDPREAEADHFADTVTGQTTSQSAKHAPVSTGAPNDIQRKNGGVDSTNAPATNEAFGQTLNQQKGQGQALPQNLRQEVEEKSGSQLGDVRLHTDAQAANLAQGVNAKAFTYGQDIYFNQGQYRPESKEGMHLLSHELKHTQQSSSAIHRVKLREYADESSSAFAASNVTDQQIKATDEFKSLNTWHFAKKYGLTSTSELELTALLACRLMLRDMRHGGSIKWSTDASTYFLRALRQGGTARSAEKLVGTEALWTGSGIDGGKASASDTVMKQWILEESNLAKTDKEAEAAMPAVNKDFTMNCWEMVMLAAVKMGAGGITWKELYDMYNYPEQKSDVYMRKKMKEIMVKAKVPEDEQAKVIEGYNTTTGSRHYYFISKMGVYIGEDEARKIHDPIAGYLSSGVLHHQWEADRLEKLMTGPKHIWWKRSASPAENKDFQKTKPLPGDIVIFNTYGGHTTIATGNMAADGTPEIISFWPPPDYMYEDTKVKHTSAITGEAEAVDFVKRISIGELMAWDQSTVDMGANFETIVKSWIDLRPELQEYETLHALATRDQTQEARYQALKTQLSGANMLIPRNGNVRDLVRQYLDLWPTAKAGAYPDAAALKKEGDDFRSGLRDEGRDFNEIYYQSAGWHTILK